MGKFDGQALPGLTYVKSFSRWPVTGSVGALESGIHGATYLGTLPSRLFGGAAGPVSNPLIEGVSGEALKNGSKAESFAAIG